MNERIVGKTWTKEEDNLLIQAVQAYGGDINWKVAASYVPGRTNKACRKRWLHSLSPSIKKSIWTQDEDELLLRLYEKYGTKWSVIAREIPGRTDDACSKRYREALDPFLKRDEWTPEEDQILLEAYNRMGTKWGEVGKELNRSRLACRNRWRMLDRRKIPSPNGPTRVPEIIEPAVSSEPTQMLSQDWDVPMDFIETQPYWDTDTQPYTSPTDMMQSDLSEYQQTHSAVYLSPDYSTTSDLSPLHPLVPFQSSSSSLSSALSLSAISPSSAYAGSPISNRIPEIQVANRTPTSNSGSSLVSPYPIATVDSRPQHASPDQTYRPSSPRSNSSSSPDLSALGTQDLSIPVPFDDTHPQTYPSAFESSMSELQQTSPEARSYPTPLPSPTMEGLTQPSVEDNQISRNDPTRHYRTPAQKRAADSKDPSSAKKGGRVSAKNGPPRLSASLPATTDPSVLAYVCGHDTCWPPGATMSSRCYNTSQELYDHWKIQHAEDATCERPYRCGIEGCGKGWKSINGLQYHLQLSKAHFQKAISATITSQADAPADGMDAYSGSVKKKMYACVHPGCSNQYKQMSGLRYHLIHGHSQQLPTQLNYVPPALARKVAGKIHGRLSQQEGVMNPTT
ncbi:hypothetical protein BDW22DRAFT_1344257 [Trametopsis cervina]|nr:hypothetical protein BDW22DRAFT_1344257 [Trametopsis cervina]